ncbi:MAG TPA: aspartyl protease family protein [Myxococcota bacterium]|jgi:predicted aspartyl protease|nr:aspartyl protease family protein [Myxococcota bacterium]
MSRRMARMGSRALGALLGLSLVSIGVRAEPAPDPPADAVLASLPFESAALKWRKIAIDLAPDGNARRLHFILDTGATNSVVTPRLARSMGVKVSRTRSDPYRRATSLGRDVLFYVDTRRSDTAARGDFEFGVLGGDFLTSYVVEIDFEKKQVRFLDPVRFETPASGGTADEASLPLKIVSNRPALRATVDGHAIDLLIDTGAPPALMLSGAVASEAGVAFTRVEGYELRGTVGNAEGHAGDVARLELGPFAIEKVPAIVAPNGFYNLGFPGDSILGYDLLAQFLVRIDYPRQRIWLRRRADAPAFFDPRSTAANKNP